MPKAKTRAPSATRGDGKRGGEPTPQGFQGAGPGNRHGLPPEDSPGQGGLGERPFSPEGGRPAADPDAMARRVLDRARQGPPAEGHAYPLGAEEEQARSKRDR